MVSATTVRIPVFYGHSEVIHIETKKPMHAKDARKLLSRSPGIEVIDDLETVSYPTPAVHAAGTDPVYVGRIRNDIGSDKGLNLWVVADNIRKGAALNSIQIAEILLNKYIRL
jgi:aspartate-semialdehyde dehydrogenase